MPGREGTESERLEGGEVEIQFCTSVFVASSPVCLMVVSPRCTAFCEPAASVTAPDEMSPLWRTLDGEDVIDDDVMVQGVSPVVIVTWGVAIERADMGT